MLGAPTASFSVTIALALVTFATVIVAGTLRFGVVGFWKNQVPSMGLPMVLAIPIVPMVFAIEVLGLFIKHAVLGVRLLANMVAGHLVLLAIMGLAVAAAGSPTWWLTALDFGGGLGIVQFAGAVRGVPAGLCVYILVGVVHRRLCASSLTRASSGLVAEALSSKFKVFHSAK